MAKCWQIHTKFVSVYGQKWNKIPVKIWSNKNRNIGWKQWKLNWQKIYFDKPKISAKALQAKNLPS